jgi:ribosome biogenesis protein Tsr3
VNFCDNYQVVVAFSNNYTSNECTSKKLLKLSELKFTQKKLGFFHALLVDPKCCTLLGKDYLKGNKKVTPCKKKIVRQLKI